MQCKRIRIISDENQLYNHLYGRSEVSISAKKHFADDKIPTSLTASSLFDSKIPIT